MDPDDPNYIYTEGESYVILSDMVPETAYGLSVDGNRLYVTNNTSTIHFYDTDTWTHLGTRNVGRKAMDIAVDPNNGEHPAYLYAGGFQPPAGSGSHEYLIKHNLEDPNSGNHIEKDIGAVAIGLAVDPDTGLVYVTTFDYKVCVYDCSSSDPNDFSPTDCEDDQGFSGPAGICVPTGNVNYKYPLPVSKTDNVNPDDCVSPDAADPNVTYTINFFPNEHYNCAVVVTDFLPWGVDFLAADPNYYVYDPLSRSVAWEYGDLPPYNPDDPDPNEYFHITVQVNNMADPSGELINRVEIESDVSYDVAANTTGICCWGGEIIYVNADAPASSAQTGTRWEDAYIDLQSALSRAVNGCGSEIWIAKGFYSPGNQAADTFDIPSGVSLFGGFNGGETDRSQRNYLLNQTWLTGFVDYVVTMNGAVSSAPLDGLIISGASSANIYCAGGEPNIANCIIQNSSGDGVYCNHSDPIIENCLIKLNHSAGIYCYNYSDPNISHCLVRENLQGVRIDGSSAPEITNCWIDHNDNDGICIYSYSSTNSQIVIRNNTIVCNDGNGIYLSWGNPQITNCILWDNDDDLYGCSATYSCIEDNDYGIGNIHEDPNFAYGLNNASYNYHLDPGSPCKNAGDSEVINTGELDIDGDERIIDGYVDMGADEIACNDVSQELDLNADGVINFHEYARLAYAWLSHDPNDPEFSGDPNECTHWNARFDFDDDYDIDLADLAFFCTDFWLWIACWHDVDSGMMMSRSMSMDSSGRESLSSVSLSPEQLEQARLTRWLRTRPAYEPTDYEKLLQLRDLLDWLDLLWQQDEDLRKQFTEDQWFDWMKSVYQQILDLESRCCDSES